jgi:hypothetical protein
MSTDSITNLLLLFLLLGAVVVYLSATAGRLDRVHQRIETADAALDAQLLRRAALSTDLADSGLLDPATSLVLGDAARRAATVDPADEASRSAAESGLTRVLGEVFATDEDTADVLGERDGEPPDPDATELLTELAAACRRVELARRFHNDAVASARELRRRRLVRWFRLAGRTPWPQTVELADTPPPGLAGR